MGDGCDQGRFVDGIVHRSERDGLWLIPVRRSEGHAGGRGRDLRGGG